MIEFTRCPKCSTLYELEGVDLGASSGWVQCGDCDRKFKAVSHAVEPDELSFTVSSYSMGKSMKMAGSDSVSEDDVENSMQIIEEAEDSTSDQTIERTAISAALEAQKTKPPVSQDYQRQQLSEQLQDRDSEFMEHTIILPDELTDEDEDFEDIFNSFSEDIFSPELIDEEESEGLEESEQRQPKQVKNTYAELHSEFSEEVVIVEPDYSEKTILEEELESNTTINTETSDEVEYKTYDVDPPNKVMTIVNMSVSFIVMAVLVGLFTLQVHSRGTYQWIPQKNYDGLLSRAPFLSKLEKTQTNLSAIRLASTRMEVNEDNPDARVIILQLINRSYSNQAYPDFQLEFTDAKGDTIARKVVLPSLYLEKGHLGLLESREAKIVLFNLESLPTGAVGYQIKVVQQSS